MDDIRKYAALGRVSEFLDREEEDGLAKLELLLAGNKLLINTHDVAQMTGWSEQYIGDLCRQELIPHIPGKPYKFIYKPLREAVEKLLVGGIYGRRKAKTKRSRKCS